MRQTFSTAWILLVLNCGLHADVRYTTHTEIRLATEPNKARVAKLAALVPVPEPPADTVTYVGADSVRIEQSSGAARLVVLLRSDGQIVLDPEAQTYVRSELGNLLKDAAAAPKTAFRRTGQFSTVLGMKAERIELTTTVPLPIGPIAGFPTVVTTTGELWLADAYRELARGVQKAMSHVTALPAGLEGIVLRQVMRSAEFGYEVESRVTEIVEGPIASDMFTVPAGYRDVTSRPAR